MYGVLKNKYNIENRDELHNLEEKIVLEKLSLLILNPYFGNFNAKHLRDIHKFLFYDLYDFAGCYREVDLYKKYTKFEDPNLIKKHLETLLEKANLQIRNHEINVDNKFSVAMFLGDLYYELIMIHPFREGNGRAIREFIRELIVFSFPEYEFEYSKINKDNFLMGVVEHDTYPMLLAYEFNNGLVKVDVKSK